MKMRKVGKIAILLGATAALVATLVNDKKKKSEKLIEDTDN